MRRCSLAAMFGTFAAFGSLGGCANFDREWARLSADIMPPTPSEAARDVFNISDADKRRNGIALLSAARFGGEAAYLRMYRLLIDDPDATVRAACIKALGDHGELEDVPRIIPRLRDEAPFVRWEAAKALQKIHHTDAIVPLMDATIKDEDDDVRMAAAYALGQYPERRVFDVLVGALDDPNYAVSAAARQSLQTMTGQSLSLNAADWIRFADDAKGNLFAAQKQYVWQPYEPPEKWTDTIQFWKTREIPSPRPPRGLAAAGASTAPSTSP